MSIQLAGLDLMGELESRRDLALFWICRVLIKLQLRDSDRERRRLRFVSQPFHQNLRREEFLIEDDLEFAIGRPILGWAKNQLAVRIPRPRAGDLRFEPDAFERRLLQVFESRGWIAESNNQRRIFQLLVELG